MLAGVASVLHCARLRGSYMAFGGTCQYTHFARHHKPTSCFLARQLSLRPTSTVNSSCTAAAPAQPLSARSSRKALHAIQSAMSTTADGPHQTVAAGDGNAAGASTIDTATVADGAAGGGGPVQVQDTIALTPAETEIFETLLAATRHSGAATVLRCAGGWVRDKLLGRGSDDIDIALDDMLGKDFAELVNASLKAQGREARHAAVIQSNPDQSKHLETARMKIGEVWIDLVNLRSETYAADSRIPTMTFGTAEQDAHRRDFTVNALFYNISAGGVVEDLTGRGLQDLRDGLIRTPLPPMETFLDDPLRVLRAVRFGTRFGFRLHPDILEAAASEQVRVALGTKISKERVGTELEGMFNGPAPVDAVRLLHQLGLFTTVFSLPPPLDSRLGSGYGAPCCVTMAAADAIAKGLALEMDKDERRFLLLASLLLPLRGLQHTPAKGKPVPATSALIRDSLKWRVKDIDMTAALHETTAELAVAHAVLRRGSGGGATDAEPDVRVMLGQVIRKLKQHWKLGVALAPVTLMRSAAPLEPGSAPADAAGEAEAEGGEAGEAAAAARLEMSRELLAAVEAYGLAECWTWKPLMDGKKAMGLLGWSKPGPELGKVMAAVMDWQLVHPKGTLQEAEEMVKARFGAGVPEV